MHKVRKAFVALAGMSLALGAFASVAAADPVGNNGTIKVDREVFDTDPNNEPHVGCLFQVDFYGFDQGDLFADVTFAVHPPTGKDVVLRTDIVDIGEDAAGGG